MRYGRADAQILPAVEQIGTPDRAPAGYNELYAAGPVRIAAVHVPRETRRHRNHRGLAAPGDRNAADPVSAPTSVAVASPVHTAPVPRQAFGGVFVRHPETPSSGWRGLRIQLHRRRRAR